MKSFHWIPLATLLACGSVFAQPATPAGTSGFVTAAQADTTPARAAAADALKNLAAHVGAAGTTAPGTARALERADHARHASPPGFPLAVDDTGKLAGATIGWGFAVNDVLPADLAADADLAAAARPTGQWRYAIMLHGKPIGLVTVVDTGDGWQAVSFGAATLSADIDTLVRQRAGDPDMTLRYVRVPQATADFIEVSRHGAPARYVPLQAARASLHLDRATPRTGADLVPALREAARRNLAVSH